eukprot:Gb_29939 [translate_table: standard]
MGLLFTHFHFWVLYNCTKKQTNVGGLPVSMPFCKDNETACPPAKKRKLTARDDSIKQTPATKSNGREALPFVYLKQEVEDPVQLVTANGQDKWEEIKMSTSEVEALLNMKMTGKGKYDVKGKTDQMMDYIKKLRTCIRKFLDVETAYILQKEQLNAPLFVIPVGCMPEVRNQYPSFCFTDRLDFLTEMPGAGVFQELLLVHENDSEALCAAQNERSRLVAEIYILKDELSTSTEEIKSLQETNKKLTQYNTDLQLYNSKLQNDAANAMEEILQTKQEKAAIVETLGSVRGNAAALQSQLENAKARTKQRTLLNEELQRVRGELQRAIETRDQCMNQIRTLTEENARFGAYKAVALEERCKCQSEQIDSLSQQLDIGNLKLQVAEASLAQHKQNEGGLLTKVEVLQVRLAEAEHQLHDGELLRRKLHNTIQIGYGISEIDAEVKDVERQSID